MKLPVMKYAKDIVHGERIVMRYFDRENFRWVHEFLPVCRITYFSDTTLFQGPANKARKRWHRTALIEVKN